MKFRLLIESATHTTIRELHVERVTGPLDDVYREHVQVLEMVPVADGEDDDGHLADVKTMPFKDVS